MTLTRTRPLGASVFFPPERNAVGLKADCVNMLGRFCGPRDVFALTQDRLRESLGVPRADVMVLFGGSILAGADVLAHAVREDVAHAYAIVGGAGHTTEALRRRVQTERPDITTAGRCEAEIFDRYLAAVYGLHADLLETASTNCGNNVTNLLALLKARDVPHDSLIICQDATMQRRMAAGLALHAPQVRVVNFAAYDAHIVERDGELAYAREPHGSWDIERYVSLLMGEIPRLHDTTEGYGPTGRGFIAHVDVPDEVLGAFETLRDEFGVRARVADPRFASRAGCR